MATQKQNSDAIVVSLYGGLGNQLFQYATGRALSIRNGLPLILDLTWFDEVKKGDASVTTVREYALTPFQLAVQIQVSDEPSPVSPSFTQRILRGLFRNIPTKSQGSRIVREKGFEFDLATFEHRGPAWLQGYWQSYRYFDDAAKVLREELGQPQQVSVATQAMLDSIRQSDAICLHIRRGDYVTNKHAAATHGLCTLDYYAKGVEALCADLQNPQCFVFSDDPQWARTNLNLTIPITIVDINGPDAAHQDLWLMAACKRFVIANSSLSWWGAWLSDRQGKRVVAPNNWFADRSKNTRDLLPEDWIRI